MPRENDPLSLLAPAKVNFSLEIIGKRPDGYHELRMLMAPISLYDEIKISPTESCLVEVFSAGSDYVSSGEDNICHRAASFYFKETGISGGAKIDIRKNIPVGAGLGGGSSDGAATIMGLERLFGRKLSREERKKAAFEVGADLPFFFARGWALVEGIGEKVTPVTP
ncbi:MAG: 4-(cytidine 5'-diphospho)-2-C-methyl-D-erythritol kinase [Deltaproteobacteria bacterium]|nr:MAG: 4-(cytidine 5'-diphospho)-2-C-methyl-D-erythritol kinase [Deltaproteobacteria bacterium]